MIKINQGHKRKARIIVVSLVLVYLIQPETLYLIEFSLQHGCFHHYCLLGETESSGCNEQGFGMPGIGSEVSSKHLENRQTG